MISLLYQVFFISTPNRLRHECIQRQKVADAVARRNQEESTRSLAERCRDLGSFRILMLREWQDMNEELSEFELCFRPSHRQNKKLLVVISK
jgi:hypothetical protein